MKRKRVNYELCYYLYILASSWSSLRTIHGCLIAGADTGECTAPTDFDQLLPFCSSVVQYTACIPRYQSLWYNHSVLTKDKFIEQLLTKIVIQRKIYETNDTMMGLGIDEWGLPHDIVPRFIENPDCENAFRNYFCWMNFPRCDAQGRSLLMCRSVCENFFTACQQPRDLWRCGEPKYVNGYEAEISTTWINKEQVYYRAPFPGSPFRDNAFDPDTKKPIVVCTPSLENASVRTSGVVSYWWSMLFITVLKAFF